MIKNEINYYSIHGINKYINKVFYGNKPKLEEIQKYDEIFTTFTNLLN